MPELRTKTNGAYWPKADGHECLETTPMYSYT